MKTWIPTIDGTVEYALCKWVDGKWDVCCPVVEIELDDTRWIKVEDELPPFDTLIEVKAHIPWKTNPIVYVIDKLTRQQEQLEYGQMGYLLQEHSDFVFIQHPEPEQFSYEYATHWRLFKEPTEL